MRNWLRMAALAIAALLVTACVTKAPSPASSNGSTTPSNEAKSTGSQADLSRLVIAVDTEPRLLDPLVDDTVTFHGLQRMVYEPLVGLAKDTAEPQPFLAKSWEVSEDAKTYTFVLQQGVTFHDGTPFNADAVKYSIERVKGVNVFAAPLIRAVKSVEVVNDSTVKLHLSSPDSTLLKALHWVFMVSPKAFQENAKGGDWAKAWAAEHMVGTGPYALEKWDRGTQMTFAQFAKYWRGWDGNHFKTVVAKYVPERATQRLLVERGDIDLAMAVSPEDLQALKSHKDVYVFEYPGLKAGHIGFNTTRGLTANPLIRKAIAYAFPRSDMIAALQGIGKEATGPYAEGLIGKFATELPGYKHDLEKAKSLLAEAGHPNGGIELELVYYTGWKWEELAATLLQSELQKINVKVTLVGSEWPPMYERLLDPKRAPDMYAFGSTSWLTDPSAVFGPYFSCDSRGEAGYNWMYYCNKQLDQVVANAMAATDSAQKAALYQQATAIVADDAPWFTTDVELSAYAVRKTVKGLYSNPVSASENILDFYAAHKE